MAYVVAKQLATAVSCQPTAKEQLGGGIGVEYRWTDNRLLALNLNYYDLGEAPINVEIPVGEGNITGKYTKHESIGIDVSFRWIR